MRLLVDTRLLLWAAGRSWRLPELARRLLEDPANEVLFRLASLPPLHKDPSIACSSPRASQRPSCC